MSGVLSLSEAIEAIDLALEFGCTVDDLANTNLSALMICSQFDQIKPALYLIKMGANPFLSTTYGSDALLVAKSAEMKALLLKAAEDYAKPAVTPKRPPSSAAAAESGDFAPTGAIQVCERNPKACDTCGTKEAVGENRFPICPGCMTAKYCDRECQNAGWRKHKKLCAGLAKAKADEAVADEV